jgi:3-deoxy-D-manno-octulosonate 8-phosphate phosphatase KdsC-like HAD superfamily phosphatase
MAAIQSALVNKHKEEADLLQATICTGMQAVFNDMLEKQRDFQDALVAKLSLEKEGLQQVFEEVVQGSMMARSQIDLTVQDASEQLSKSALKSIAAFVTNTSLQLARLHAAVINVKDGAPQDAKRSAVNT